METSTRRGLPRAMVDDVFLAPVHINAGGTVYTTTLDTLTKYPESKLAKLFDGTLAISIDPISRQYFLDVNGSVFAHVLDFLRYGELLLPEDFTQLPLLIKLAVCFEMQDMIQALINMGGEGSSGTDEEGRNTDKQKKKKRRNKKHLGIVSPSSESHENHKSSLELEKMDSPVETEMIEALTVLGDQENNSSQNESEEDNKVETRRERRRGWKKSNSTENCFESNIKMNKGINIGDRSANKDIGTKHLGSETVELKAREIGPIRSKSLNVETIKSETSEVMKVEAKRVETDSIKTGTIEVGAIKSEVTEMVSIGAVNVEMTSVDAGAVRTKSLEVGTLMAMALEVGTLKASSLETETPTGPVKVVLVRFDEYYKVIDVYSPDELTLLDPTFPHQLIRSEYVGNCNRLYFKFADLPCTNPQTTYKFGVPYLLHFFKQLLNKGYRFSSVISAGELNYTRDYLLIRFPPPTTRQ